jgi:hypothetical protein
MILYIYSAQSSLEWVGSSAMEPKRLALGLQSTTVSILHYSIPGLNPPTTAEVVFALAFLEPVDRRFCLTGTVYAPCAGRNATCST